MIRTLNKDTLSYPNPTMHSGEHWTQFAIEINNYNIMRKQIIYNACKKSVKLIKLNKYSTNQNRSRC